MNRMSPAQQLLVYFVVDHIGLTGRISAIEEQLNSLRKQLDSNSATRSRVQCEVFMAYAVTAERIEPTHSHRFRLSGKSPGCDLGKALQEILSNLQKSADADRSSKVEVIVLLASEPSGDWEGGLRALARRGAGVTVVAFASKQEVRDETLKKIGTQAGRALRLDLFDVETAKRAFSWIEELLQQSVELMDRAPVAKPRAASPLSGGQATPRPAAVPQSPAVGPPAISPLQKAPADPRPPTVSQSPVIGPSPASLPQEAQVTPMDAVPQAPVSPGVGEVPVSAGDAVPLAEGPEPPRADGQELLPPEEAALDLDTKEDTQREGRKAMPEESAPPATDVLSVKEEGLPVGVASSEQPQATPSAEEAVSVEGPVLSRSPERSEGTVEGEMAPTEEGASVEIVIEPEPEPPRVTKDGVATIWEEREPTDPSDPVRHTDARILEAPGGWRIVGASRRGKMHAHKGIYREDAFALGEANGWHLVVVADGGGSCPLSRVGAQLAADTAVATMVHSISKSDDQASPIGICETALRESVKAAWEALQNEAQKRNRDIKDFGTTFLAMMHRPDEASHIIGVLQVGDGLVAAELTDGKVKALAEPDVGETAGVTLFLTSKPWERWVDRATVIPLESPLKLLTAMCDGVADDFIPFDPLLRKLFDALDGITKQEQPDQALLNLLAYEKRGSFDDRTLALLYQAQARPGQGVRPEAEPEAGPRASEQPVEKQPEESNLDRDTG